jgi:FxsC-like protein
VTALAPARESDTRYFFLSHTPGQPDLGGDDPDLAEVFQDLCKAVWARRRRQWEPGFLDPGAGETDDATMRALIAAQVFVAFYSVPHLTDDRSRELRRQFESRFGGSPSDGVNPRVLPVLWEAPPESNDVPEFQQAIDIAPELLDYAELGLAALKRVGGLRRVYDRLLTVLSRRIVDVAEDPPVPPPADVVVHQPAGSRVAAATRAGQFLIAVLAPQAGELLHTDREAHRYGVRPTDWRPFEAQALPVARHVAVRCLGGPAEVVDFDPTADSFAERPGLLLVDPWILALAEGELRLVTALASLPPWVPAVVLADEDDPQYYPLGQQLVIDAVFHCGLHSGQCRDRRDIKNGLIFETVIPRWLQNAQRRFMNRSTKGPRKRYPGKPRLADRSEGEGSTNDA